MVTQIVIQDTLLNELADKWYDDYTYLGCGTLGNTTIGTETDLYGAVQVGAAASNRNKLSETGTTSSFITNNVWTRLFKLTTVQPNVLPVNLYELGIFKTEADNNDLGGRFVLNVVQTKDNTSAWNIRVQCRTSRLE